jgi:hypothetical protein
MLIGSIEMLAMLTDLSSSVCNIYQYIEETAHRRSNTENP